MTKFINKSILIDKVSNIPL